MSVRNRTEAEQLWREGSGVLDSPLITEAIIERYRGLGHEEQGFLLQKLKVRRTHLEKDWLQAGVAVIAVLAAGFFVWVSSYLARFQVLRTDILNLGSDATVDPSAVDNLEASYVLNSLGLVAGFAVLLAAILWQRTQLLGCTRNWIEALEKESESHPRRRYSSFQGRARTYSGAFRGRQSRSG